MTIYMVKSVYTSNGERQVMRRYFDTLRNAEQWAKNAGCRLHDTYGGIFRQEPNEEGQFETEECVKAW